MAPRPSSSDEHLWGSHSMPTPSTFDVLMPNGIMISAEFTRDVTLAVVKETLWVKAKNDALYRLLRDPRAYIFKGQCRIPNGHRQPRACCDADRSGRSAWTPR